MHPDTLTIEHAGGYESQLQQAHVLVDPAKRSAAMVQRLEEAAASAGGKLIEDAFLVAENLSLVEEPQVVVGHFEEEFLALPDEVILEVARGHQRYFGLRDEAGNLLPRYLAVVNTANCPEKIAIGNDRVMRARLADAQFFHREDLKRPLASRLADLDGIVFQKRLGTIHQKVQRMKQLVASSKSQEKEKSHEQAGVIDRHAEFLLIQLANHHGLGVGERVIAIISIAAY